ncbi:hypothetical protein AB0A74_31885 [Saccharothrix sp. NPDC042600]|uniref:hypothetical protein n=1 Tax=Saccharothrix TaxID=2071 RepID=UPI0033DEB062|nr:hypothetical protein GCM10017745_41150 [Saccharothrix mutabilis subsp. capreolus]
MSTSRATVEQWLALSHPELVDRVRAAVRPGSGPVGGPVWTDIAAHPVLSARVRGVLSSLAAQSSDFRDGSAWRARIEQAQAALRGPSAPATRPPTHLRPVPQVVFQAPGQPVPA